MQNAIKKNKTDRVDRMTKGAALERVARKVCLV